MSSKGALRRHPELIMFLIGLLLFLAGLTRVIIRQLEPKGLPRETDNPALAAEGIQGRVGPVQNEPLGPYIEKKKKLLEKRAADQGGQSSYGIVVFAAYKKPADIERFLSSNRLEVSSLQTRIPVAPFKPEDVPLGDKDIREAAATQTGQARIDALTEELRGLESLSKDADDPAAEEVFEEDIAAHRKAVDLLKKDGAVIFALVVKGTNSSLAKAARAPEVRFVDVPDNTDATPKNHTFAGVIPDDKQNATFGET